MLIHKSLGFGKILGSLTLYHITEKRPWRTGKANQRYATVEFVAGQRDSLHHVIQLLRYIFSKDRKSIIYSADGVPHHRTFAFNQFYIDTQCLRYGENIRKDERCIGLQLINRLEGDLTGQLRCLHALRESIFLADLHILRQVAPRLTHHPYRRTLYFF